MGCADGGGIAFLLPGAVLLIASAQLQMSVFLLVGAAIALFRNQIVFDPTERWVQRRLGIAIPFVPLSKRRVSQVVLEEKVTGSHKSRRRDYHVMVIGSGAAVVSVARETDLAEARRVAEDLARSSGLALLDLATGAGLRSADALDQSLRSRIRAHGWQPRQLPPPGRLRTDVAGDRARVELPRVSRFGRLFWPLVFPVFFAVVFGALAITAALGLNKGGHDPILVAVCTVPAAICVVILIVTIYLHRRRFTRVHHIEVGPEGLILHATRFGRERRIAFGLDEIESIGLGGEATLSSFGSSAQAVVIASDRQLATIGAGLTPVERGFLAAFLTQALVRA